MRSIGVLEKSYLNFRKHASVAALKKLVPPKFLGTTWQNSQRGVLFKYTRTLASLPGTIIKSSLVQLFYRESVSACFC